MNDTATVALACAASHAPWLALVSLLLAWANPRLMTGVVTELASDLANATMG